MPFLVWLHIDWWFCHLLVGWLGCSFFPSGPRIVLPCDQEFKQDDLSFYVSFVVFSLCELPAHSRTYQVFKVSEELWKCNGRRNPYLIHLTLTNSHKEFPTGQAQPWLSLYKDGFQGSTCSQEAHVLTPGSVARQRVSTIGEGEASFS